MAERQSFEEPPSLPDEAVRPVSPVARLPLEPQRERPLIDWQSVVIAAGLIVIVAVAAYFRFIGQNWDDYTHLHPDERFLTQVTTSIEPVSSLDAYFNTSESSLNPNNRGSGFYVYGTLPLFVVKAAAGLTVDYTGDINWGGYNGVQLVGRSVSAVADLLTLLFTFLIGRRLYGRWTGLLAAALYAGAVLPIQLSHFWTTDAFTSLPVVIAVWFAVRVLDDGGWVNYAGFGVALGAAVASRVNVAPLAIVLALATLIRILPIFKPDCPTGKRNRLLNREVGGLILAALVSVAVFRVAQPYAFSGPGILGILPNMDWIRQMQEVSRQVSGQVDFPPNFQWASRTPYVFAWYNMVMWGMGLPLGIMAWAGWAWAGVQVLRGRPNWTRHLLPVVWILIYFGWQGRQWVMTMRYYMPLYPFLILLAAWALTALVRRAWRAWQERPLAWRRVRLGLAVGLLALVVAFTLVWGFAFSRIYTHQLTRVQASQWVLQNIPADYSLTIEDSDGSTRMINLGLPNDTLVSDEGLTGSATRYFEDGQLRTARFRAASAEVVSRVQIDGVAEPVPDADEETLWVSLWDVAETRLLGEGTLTADFGQFSSSPGDLPLTISTGSDVPSPDQLLAVQFAAPVALVEGREYELQMHARAGWPFTVGTVTVGSFQIGSQAFGDGNPAPARFTAFSTGTVTSVHAAHLGDPLRDSEPETLWVGLWDVAEQRLLGEGTLTAEFSQGSSPLGQPYDILLEEPVTLLAGREYELQTRAVAGAPFVVAGAAIATEGPWDDPIPWKVCALPDGMVWSPDLPPGLVSLSECQGIDGFGMGYYQGLELFMAAEDNEQKRETMLSVLDSTDYLTISSNRFYDTLPRLPMRFPLSIRYYDALFSGELGFELIETFSSTFRLDGWAISDQYLPTYDAPRWLNEWEAEEAFHVYDHPVVFVFRKTADYDPQAVARILNSVELTSASDVSVYADGSRVVGVIPWSAPQASAGHTALMLPDDVRAIQVSGGTWSELYDTNAVINQSDAAAAVAWWVVLMLLGWIIWPTLFAIFPALADRAYPLAKVAGLLVVSWLAWYGASLGLHTWTPGGIGAAMALVALTSLYFAWRRRADLVSYVRRNIGRLLAFEGLTLLLFLVFLAIRWGNPDLWHPSFGGEKPMDFAYLNAVLRSTLFPPYNPWYAGGYINYYYYGFVLVGTPIKLLGLVPSVGYNLILATLFALTGMGAFSAAYNLVASLRRRKSDGSWGSLVGNPWVAGVTAMLLAVVMGNLDDIRLLVDALSRTGGAPAITGGGGGGAFLPILSDVIGGIGNLLSGQPLNFSTHWWFWNPTRVIAHTGNAITEIPFFTFLYGDPHAHAIALPLTLLVVGWLINEVLIAGRAVGRSRLGDFLALALGALTIFILRATNFADWVTYLVLTLFGLTFANYLWHQAQRRAQADSGDKEGLPYPGPAWRLAGLFGGAALYWGWVSFKRLHLTRAVILRWGGQVAAFLVLGTVFIAPYSYWYATADAVPELWQGAKTPLWAYVDLNGVFLLLVISLLVWDTADYLRTIRVRQLIGFGTLVMMALIGLVWLAGIALALTVGGYETAIMALPVAFWAALLCLRPGQSREMRMVWAAVVLAVVLTFVVDLVIWAGDIGRQNTVFKFYMQVWILLSIAGGAAFAWLLRASERWKDWLRNTWMTGVTVLFTVAAMYPLLATQAKLIDRMAPDAPRSLDGMEFMAYATEGENGEYFTLDEDYQMIRWMQENIQGSPVILEASVPEYRWGSRVSVYTGLPTVVGYNFHERQQHTLDPLSRLVEQRVQNVATMYDTTDIETAWRLLRYYDVSYVVVGKLERVYHSYEGLAKFQRMVNMGLLDVVFEQGETRVYAVRQDANWDR